MASAFDQISFLLREGLEQGNPVVDLHLDEVDPLWDLTDTFQPTDVAGRDADSGIGQGTAGYFAEWRVRVNRSGLVAGSDFTGNTVETMGGQDHIITGQGSDDLFPDPGKAAVRSYVPIRMQLRRMKGVLPLNRSQIIADMMASSIEDVSTGLMEDAIFLIRKMTTSHAYSDGGGSLARADGAASILEGTPVAVSIKAGRPLRFQIGQRYVSGTHVAQASHGSSQRTGNAGTVNDPGVFRCVDIDTDDLTPVFESEPGEGTITLTDGDDITLHGMCDYTAANVTAGSKAPQGLENLLITSGTFPGSNYKGTAMNVSNHRYLKSYVKGDVDAKVAPTPEIVSEFIDKITDTGKVPPSVVLAEQSVWTAWATIEKQAGAVYNVPQGATFQASGGVSGPRVTHGSAEFARVASPEIREGCIIGLSPETFKKSMPLNKTVRWQTSEGGAAGAPSIFRPVTSGRQLTGLMSAEFEFFLEFGCTDPRRNFRRVGLHSQRTLSV